jgi:hypothetical protein
VPEVILSLWSHLLVKSLSI